MNDDISGLKEAEQERFEDENHTPPEKRGKNNSVAGLVLIAIGLIFLISNVTNWHLDNWWALFIMIPALTNFCKAWRSYQRHGRFTRSARGSLTGGLILTLVSSAFLFDLDWGLIWPLFLIIGGLSALMGGWFD